MLQNLTKGKMVEWVVLLVALVALGLSIAAVAKPCKSDFADKIKINGKILPGTAEGKACRNDMACRGGPSYVCPPGYACVPREGKISNCVKGEKEKTFICDDGGSGPGQQHDCCDPNEPNDCSSTAPGNLQCVPDSRCSPGSGYSCQPGGHSPSTCTKMGNPCRDTDDPPCCPGLTCNAAADECVQESPGPIPKKKCEENMWHCSSISDCNGTGCSHCGPHGMCTSKTTAKSGSKKDSLVVEDLCHLV